MERSRFTIRESRNVNVSRPSLLAGLLLPPREGRPSLPEVESSLSPSSEEGHPPAGQLSPRNCDCL